MTLREKQSRFVKDVAHLVFYAYSIGVELSYGNAKRTRAQQILFYTGYTLELIGGMLPKLVKSKRRSKTMSSKHLNALAVDFNFFINGEYITDHLNPKIQKLGSFWEAIRPENKWGGNFQTFIDAPHFQTS